MSKKDILVVQILLLLFSAPFLYANEDYRIGVEDKLFISVWDNTNLSMTVTVRPDGKISFPLIDDIQAAGKTAVELRDNISKRLSPFISNPDVTVIVTSIESRKIFIFGEVNRPGVYSVSRDTTILHILSMAGGLTNNEDLRLARLIRDNRIVPVDFFALLEKGDISQNITLLPDDTVYIPDNFKNRISVVGEVKNPMNVTFRQGMTILDAILSAGGITEFARQSDTKIYRKNVKGKDSTGSKDEKIEDADKKKMHKKSGVRTASHGGVDFLRKNGEGLMTRGVAEDKKPVTEDIISIDLDDIMKHGDMSKNIPLMPRDIIIVPKSIF